MPDSGPEEIILEITADGAAATWWWTEETDQILYRIRFSGHKFLLSRSR